MKIESKYPELNLTEGMYYVYAHAVTTEDNRKLYYVGMSKQQPAVRWQPSKYKDTSLWPFIEKYGWANIQHQVLAVVSDKRSAETLEDQMIMALSMNGMVINDRRSGGHRRDNDDVRKEYMREYNREYREEHKEEIRESKRKYREEHKEEIREHNQTEQRRAANRKSKAKQRAKPENKIYDRVFHFNRRHPYCVIETPLEAKQRYLQEGYIPNYIKNEDLQ